MVFGRKPIGKLITLDKYLSVRQNKGPVWILEPQSLKRLITSSIYLSDEQNLKGVCLLGSPTFSPSNRTKILHGPQTQTYGEINNS